MAIWDKWFKKGKGTKKKPLQLQVQEEKKTTKKKAKSDKAFDLNIINKLIGSSFDAGKMEETLHNIHGLLSSINEKGAKQDTLDKVWEQGAKESSLKELDQREEQRHQHLITSILKGAQARSYVPIDVPEGKKRIERAISKEVDHIIEGEEKIKEEDEKKILQALKTQGKLPFGNDARTKGLSKYTGINRTRIYTLVYKGWDSKGKPDKPRKGTLAERGLVEVVTKDKPFRVRLK